jgi:hypothetical protein
MQGIVAALVVASVLVGCASVTRGWNNQLQFSSDPPEATVRTSLGHQCLTPCTLQVGRKDEFTAIFSKQGFHSVEVPVRTRIAGGGAAGFAGNVVLGGVIGMGVDAASGATLEHCPNPISVRLRPANGREPSEALNPNCAPPPEASAVSADRESAR